MNEVMIKNSESAILKLKTDLKNLTKDTENRVLMLQASVSSKAKELSIERHRLACYKQGIEPNTSNVITRSEWDKMDPISQAALCKGGGRIIDD